MYLIYKILFIFILYSASSFSKTPQITNELGESSNQLKATYIYNLIHYIHKQKNHQNRTKFTICLYKKKNLFNSLRKYEDKKVKNRTIQLKEIYEERTNLKACSMLILPKLKDKQLKHFIHKAKNSNVITLSDVKDCAKKGVMIYIKDLSSKMVFEMNLKEMQKAEIKLSSKILQLSKIVER